MKPTWVGNFEPSKELSEADEETARISLRTMFEQIRRRVDYEPCLFIRQTGPITLGMMAFDVCGLPLGHNSVRHRAGWTGSGEMFA